MDDDVRDALLSSIERLKPVYESYRRKEDLKPGDIVRWKAGLSNRRFPVTDSLAIVTNTYPVPIYDRKKKDAGSPYFGEPLDTVLGLFDSEGDFVEYHYDGHRLERVPADEVASGEATTRHHGSTCNACHADAFLGTRYRCRECADYDLCHDCFTAARADGDHLPTHTMRAIAPPSAERLGGALAAMRGQEALRPGDLVEWKEGLKNKRRPAEGEIAVVLEVLPTPLYDGGKGASVSYFREPLDVKLGILDNETLLAYFYDSRRLRKATLP
eukprot:m51a1_g6213 hypothetical protein (271) ;mRNA; r:179583-180577